LNFYTLNIIYALISLVNYFIFRTGVDDYLRYKRNSKTFIRKNKKGASNYWLYKKIHQEINLGYIYHLNLLLIILTALYFVIAISLGWFYIMKLPIAILALLLCCFQIPAIIFENIYHNYLDHGQPFIVIRARKFGRGYDSSLYAILSIIFAVTVLIYNLTLAI